MKKRIIIEGMCCKSCINHVKEALIDFPNVKKVKVNLKKGEAILKGTEDLSNELIRKTIEDIDYKVVGIEDL